MAFKISVSNFVLAILWISCVKGDHECGRLYGTCMWDDYPCDGDWKLGLCLGPANRKCCVHKQDPREKNKLLDPECDFQHGICQEETEKCLGRFIAGLCKGPATRKCCVENPEDPFELKTLSPREQGLKLVDGEALDKRWQDYCGMNGNHISVGNDAARHSWPWMAYLRADNSGDYCGAAVIAPNWVMTAAHCVDSLKSAKKWYVRLGEHDIYAHEETEKEYEVKGLFVHPRYGGARLRNRNDLALLKLPVKMINLDVGHINAVCMPTPDMSFQYKECYTVGWGMQKGLGDQKSGKLKQVKVNVLSRDRCNREVWGMQSGLVCTDNREDAACTADSGGPLVCKKDGRFYLAGIAAFDDATCKDAEAAKKMPPVFTRVPFYLDWVYMTTRNYRYG